MMSLVLTLLVVLIWLTVALLAWGIGMTLQRVVASPEGTWSEVCGAVLCGMSLLFAGLMVWHFFRPADGVALSVFVAIGGLCLCRERARLARLAAERPPSLYVLPVVVFALWSANHTLLRGGFDDYSYEFQAVRWFHDYPIVPGLANLHGRLGFNNSQHLYAAMLSVGPLAGAVNVVVNGLFILLVFALAWFACANLLQGKVSERALFMAALLAPCIARYLVVAELPQPGAATLKADVTAAALTIACAGFWLEHADSRTSEDRRKTLAITIVATAAMLTSVRIGSAPFALVVAGAVFVWMRVVRASRSLVAACTAIVVVFGAAIVIRGIVLSGYPLYPATVLPVDVDWRVPAAQADVERTFITTHAQARATFDVSVPEGGWIRNWLRFSVLTNRVTFVLPVGLIACLLMVPFARRPRESGEVTARGWTILWLAVAVSLVVWFVLAPSTRFAWALWWLLLASLVAMLVGRTVPWAGVVWPGMAMTVAAVATVLVLGLTRAQAVGVIWPLAFAAAWSSTMLSAARRQTRVAGFLCLTLAAFPLIDRVSADLMHGRPKQLRWIFWLNPREIPRMQLAADFPPLERTTSSGLRVYETLFSQYETPLPSTPYFNRYLELRHPGNLGGGFRNASRLAYPLFGYKPDFGSSTPDE